MSALPAAEAAALALFDLPRRSSRVPVERPVYLAHEAQQLARLAGELDHARHAQLVAIVPAEVARYLAIDVGDCDDDNFNVCHDCETHLSALDEDLCWRCLGHDDDESPLHDLLDARRLASDLIARQRLEVAHAA